VRSVECSVRLDGGVLVQRRVRSVLWLTLLCLAASLSNAAAQTRRSIRLTYLGNAGWQIDDGRKVILVDPFLTEFKNGGADNQNTNGDPLVSPDTAGIDARIHRADYIVITHGHYDHMIDAPYISRKTGAVIVCHESAAILRVPMVYQTRISSSCGAAKIFNSTAFPSE
jgi:glyoxylase-like metal-dependent hydrolase (beta-lactamase superfamily II)